MKSRKVREVDRRLEQLPPELRVFNMDDWAREADPPGDGEVPYLTCTEHDRYGCVLHGFQPYGLQPRTWSPDERHSRMHDRWFSALTGWAWRHGLTVDEVLDAINAADGEAFGG